MKVYKSYNPTIKDCKEVPQIKIKNEQLQSAGFEIGKEFTIVYKPGK